jgi:hypothetical protein
VAINCRFVVVPIAITVVILLNGYSVPIPRFAGTDFAVYCRTTLTIAVPLPIMSSSRAAARLTSMMRPRPYGPRSVMLGTTDADATNSYPRPLHRRIMLGKAGRLKFGKFSQLFECEQY